MAKQLKVADYRTRDGVPWRDMQVTRVLVDTSAKGSYHFNRGRKHGNWKSVAKPESEWGQVECEPIVPVSLGNQVNQIIEEQRKSWKRPGKLPTQVFGNLAPCHCGHTMYVRNNSPKYVSRNCQDKIPIVDLEGIFHDELAASLATPERIVAHLKAANQNLVEKEALLATHQRELQKVRDDMTRTHRRYLDGGITAQGFGQFYKPAEERLNQLTAESPKLQGEVDYLSRSYPVGATGARPSGRRVVRPARGGRTSRRSFPSHQKVGVGRWWGCLERSLRARVSAA